MQTSMQCVVASINATAGTDPGLGHGEGRAPKAKEWRRREYGSWVCGWVVPLPIWAVPSSAI